MAETKKRVRRSKEELIAELRDKIAKEKADSAARIKKMEERIKALENPPKKKLTPAQKKKLLTEEIKNFDLKKLEEMVGKTAEQVAEEKAAKTAKAPKAAGKGKKKK